MALRPRESSEESAARYRALRSGRARRAMAAKPRSSTRPARQPRRIVCDFAEPTLRAIHEALCEQLSSNSIGGDLLNRTIIAEHMVAAALGVPEPGVDRIDDRGDG